MELYREDYHLLWQPPPRGSKHSVIPFVVILIRISATWHCRCAADVWISSRLYAVDGQQYRPTKDVSSHLQCRISALPNDDFWTISTFNYWKNKAKLHTSFWSILGINFEILRFATGWTVRASNSGEGEIFRTHPDRPWGPPRLLYNGYWVFPGVKAAGAWCWPPTSI